MGTGLLTYLLVLLAAAYCAECSSNGRPVQLVAPSETRGSLRIVPEGLQLLSTIADELSVLAGKSFLLNQMLEMMHAFEVGTSIEPETKGIWFWSTPIHEGGKSILLIDTEGLFSSNVSENYDSKIFSASMLLSSYMVYTSVRTIDYSMLDYVDMLEHRTQVVAMLLNATTDDSGGNHPLQIELPKFHWLIQDYLGNMKETEGVFTRMVDAHIQHRAETGAQSSFTAVVANATELSVLTMPQTELAKLKDLSRLDPLDLLQEYRQQIHRTRQNIIANIKPKLIDGKPATGASLALLVQAVVEAFNSGRFPELPSLYTTFVQQSMIEVENKTLAWFKTKADTLTSKTPPMPSDTFKSELGKALKHCEEMVEAQLTGLRDQLSETKKSVQSEIGRISPAFEQRNMDRIKIYMHSKLLDMSSEHEKEVAAIKLPLSTTSLRTKHMEINARYRQRFVAEFGAYISIKEYETELSQFRAFLSSHEFDSERENAIQVEKELQASVLSAVSKFNDDIGKEIADIPDEETFGAIVQHVAAAALELFHGQTSDLSEEDKYHRILTDVQRRIGEAQKDAQRTLKEKIKQFAVQFRSSLQHEVANIGQPRELLYDNVLEEILDQMIHETMQKFKRGTEKYHKSSEVLDVAKQLTNDLLAQKKKAIDLNFRRYKDILEPILAKVTAQIDQRINCASNFKEIREYSVLAVSKALDKRTLSDLNVDVGSVDSFANRYFEVEVRPIFDSRVNNGFLSWICYIYRKLLGVICLLTGQLCT